MLKFGNLVRLVLLTTFFVGAICIPHAKAFQSAQVLDELEREMNVATNSPDYYVMKRIDWDKFRFDFEQSDVEYSKKQDSLINLVKLQSDTLMKFKNFNLEPKQVTAEKSNQVFLPWTLFIVVLIINLVGLGHLYKIKTKNYDIEEQYQTVEERYEESKRYWIETERKLKRQLIDSNILVDELKQRLKVSRNVSEN